MDGGCGIYLRDLQLVEHKGRVGKGVERIGQDQIATAPTSADPGGDLEYRPHEDARRSIKIHDKQKLGAGLVERCQRTEDAPSVALILPAL